MSQLLGHQSSSLPNWGTWANAASRAYLIITEKIAFACIEDRSSAQTSDAGLLQEDEVARLSGVEPRLSKNAGGRLGLDEKGPEAIW